MNIFFQKAMSQFYFKNPLLNGEHYTPKVLTIHVPIYFIFNKDKRLEIREGKAPYGINTDKRITRQF